MVVLAARFSSVGSANQGECPGSRTLLVAQRS